MKFTIKQFTFILCITVLLNSCISKEKHEIAIKYLVTIWAENNRSVSNLNNLLSRISVAETEMRQNKENKLRENTIDSLTKCYQITINSIDSSVKKVSTLKEIDPKIKLKEKTINHFTEIRILAEHSFPKLIKALSMGIKEYPDELKLNHNVIQKLVDLNQQNSNELKESASIFQSKHHISNEELIKYGL